MQTSKLEQCAVLKVPTVNDARGNLSFLNELDHVPFAIGRVYFLWGVPDDSVRGGHAHKNLQQFLIAASGALDVVLRDGVTEQTVRLDKPTEGLLIGSMVWRELENFSPNTVLLVIASAPYDESDYLRDFDDFVSATLAP